MQDRFLWCGGTGTGYGELWRTRVGTGHGAGAGAAGKSARGASWRALAAAKTGGQWISDYVQCERHEEMVFGFVRPFEMRGAYDPRVQ